MLDSVEFQALYTEIGQWVAEAIKSMLKDDGAAVQFLGLVARCQPVINNFDKTVILTNLAVDRLIGEISIVA